MKDNKLIQSLVISVVLGAILGYFSTEGIISIIGLIRYFLGQIIFFTIPLIIIGCVGSSITKLRTNATKLLGFAILIAYISTVLAGFLSMIFGYIIIPNLNIIENVENLKTLPPLIFELQIPQIMPVMSALAFSILVGLSASITKSKNIINILDEFQTIILNIISMVIIPILPIFIGATFAELAYEGGLTKQLPVFISVILIAIVGHFIWLSILYIFAGFYSKSNPKEVFKHYTPAYLTAVGTMSSAATLPIALKCAKKSTTLRKDVVDFAIPLFTNIHLCGSVLTEVFFVMTVSKLLYGSIPSFGQMLIFVVLLGVFGIGAPGVPGGTVMASLGLITGILGFDSAGTALMLTIFALQDSFGTACNVTGDGALTLILSKFAEKSKVNIE